MLLLRHLTTLSLDEVAREAGLTRAGAEHQLQAAETRYALHGDVPSTALRSPFEPPREQVASVRWPRASILRRAGAARRRTHTTVGSLAAVGALVVTGWLVTDVAGVRPTLDRETLTSPGVPGGTDAAAPSASSSPAAASTLPASAMLTPAAVAALGGGRRWTTTGTVDNTRGTGLVAPCQQARYADPQGRAALVRTFATGPRRSARGSGAAASAVQTAEVSRTAGRARRSFAVAAGWYAGCTDPRVQLLSTQQVRGAGDHAVLLVLRAWDAAFVAAVRARMTACPRKEPGTDVASLRQVRTPWRDLAVWRVTSELSDRSTISYLMGIVRDGTSIAQVGFVPDGHVGISPTAFAALAQRALDRVAALPAPGPPG